MEYCEANDDQRWPQLERAENSMVRRYRVGVVGLGVAGATTAYLLARDGCDVTLLERADQPRPIGAGVLLQRSGQEILRRLGVLENVLARAAPPGGIVRPA